MTKTTLDVYNAKEQAAFEELMAKHPLPQVLRDMVRPSFNAGFIAGFEAAQAIGDSDAD